MIARRPGRAGMSDSRRPLMLGGASVALLALLGAMAWGAAGEPTDPSTACLIDGEPPAVEVMMIDTSDQLISKQRQYVERYTYGVVDGMEPHERLIVVELTEDGRAELVLIDTCIPMQNSNEARRRFREEVEEPLGEALSRLAGRDNSPESPIIESAVAVADRDDWRDAHGEVRLHLLTDGLQNTGWQNFYQANVARELHEDLLEGVTIKIVALRNNDHEARQKGAFELLGDEFANLGGTTDYDPPGWLHLIEP